MIRRTMAAAILAFAAVAAFSLNAQAQSVTDPQDAVAIFNAAQNLHEKGRLAEALRLYEEAIKIEPQFAEAEYQRGIVQLSLGKTIDAERSFRRAVELRPEWTLAMASLGSLLVQQSKLDEAEKILVKVLTSDPSNPPALTALADLYLKTGAPSNSLQDLWTKIAILTGKASPTASLWTAQAALENALGRRGQAKQSIANALLIDGSNSSALLLAGNIAIVEGDIVKAKEILTRLTGNSSDPVMVVYLRANVLAFDGDYDEAITQLNSIKANNKDAGDLLSRITTSRLTSAVELEKALAANAN
ncbi:MAG: tetratricopeptide repeat protein, partial [Pyrinomonadaceae bacterium]